MQKISFKRCLLAAMFLATTVASAQVTIGNGKVPEDFSVLELVNNELQGLRLPQMTTAQRNKLETETQTFIDEKTGEAMGLQIFNTDTKCVETWNGTKWIQTCPPEGPYVPPIYTIPSGTGTTGWAANRWVGAFWRNEQTGERIIRSTSTVSTTWTVTVDSKYTSWVVVDNARENATLWKTDVTPNDAEDYQVSGSNTLSGTGDILFRFGLKSKNPNPSQPRYATATLTINGTDYKLFLRQGEAADYVFRPQDPINCDPAEPCTTTALGDRPLAARFSPYNLTASGLTDDVQYADIEARNGDFVDFPTKGGAMFQWAAPAGYERRAYHPVTGAPNSWSSDYARGNWEGLNTIHETCPDGWRRPTVGATNDTHTAQAASGSEIMQSLFEITFDGVGNNDNSTNHRYFGYYADGFFDRRPIGNNPNSVNAGDELNSIVSANKDAAYKGLLFTNPVTNASLFVPASGYRDNNGVIFAAGRSGYIWSSSAYNAANNNWCWLVLRGGAYQTRINRPHGLAIRCVAE